MIESKKLSGWTLKQAPYADPLYTTYENAKVDMKVLWVIPNSIIILKGNNNDVHDCKKCCTKRQI
jgi:hypothetical protein